MKKELISNEELIKDIEEIFSNNDNYCDLMLALKDYNKKYKTSVFYKSTHLRIDKFAKQYNTYRLTNMQLIFKELQKKINELNLDNLVNLLDEFSLSMKGDIDDLNNSASIVQNFAQMLNK